MIMFLMRYFSLLLFLPLVNAEDAGNSTDVEMMETERLGASAAAGTAENQQLTPEQQEMLRVREEKKKKRSEKC